MKNCWLKILVILRAPIKGQELGKVYLTLRRRINGVDNCCGRDVKSASLFENFLANYFPCNGCLAVLCIADRNSQK